MATSMHVCMRAQGLPEGVCKQMVRHACDKDEKRQVLRMRHFLSLRGFWSVSTGQRQRGGGAE